MILCTHYYHWRGVLACALIFMILEKEWTQRRRDRSCIGTNKEGTESGCTAAWASTPLHHYINTPDIEPSEPQPETCKVCFS